MIMKFRLLETTWGLFRSKESNIEDLYQMESFILTHPEVYKCICLIKTKYYKHIKTNLK